MNIVAFILWLIALIVLVFVPDVERSRPVGLWARWSAFRIALFCFILGWMIQLIFNSHSIHQ